MSKRHYIIPIFVPHKGCPHDCIFCNQKRITGQVNDLTVKDARNIIEKHLSTIKGKQANIEIAFFGGSFTGIPLDEQNRLLDLANEYVLQGQVDYIRLSTRPDYISAEIVDNLKRHNVKIVELGIQSMDKDVLSAANRGHSSEDVVKAIKLLKQKDFIVGAQLMVGLPLDNEEKALETAKKIAELKPHIARIYPVLVIKDTYLETMYLNGSYEPLTIEQAVKISKKMLLCLEKSGIKVIRIGLQPTEDLQIGQNVVAGPYHPSMRQLVETDIFKDMIVYSLNKIHEDNIREIIILANPKDLSSVIGQHKSNYRFIKEKYRNAKIYFKDDRTVALGSIIINIVNNDEKSIKMSKNTFCEEGILEGIINQT
ncbi:MAG TPA: radical SAM protein [Clostridiales bacterium]|nr:radical SAM protein [Clostridiales bacterium]